MKNELTRYWEILLIKFYQSASGMDNDDADGIVSQATIEPIDVNNCIVTMDDMVGVYTRSPDKKKLIYTGDE